MQANPITTQGGSLLPLVLMALSPILVLPTFPRWLKQGRDRTSEWPPILTIRSHESSADVNCLLFFSNPHVFGSLDLNSAWNSRCAGSSCGHRADLTFVSPMSVVILAQVEKQTISGKGFHFRDDWLARGQLLHLSYRAVPETRLKCHDDLSMGVRRDEAICLLEVLVAVTGSNTGSPSAVGGQCWMNGVRGVSILWPAASLFSGVWSQG